MKRWQCVWCQLTNLSPRFCCCSTLKTSQNHTGVSPRLTKWMCYDQLADTKARRPHSGVESFSSGALEHNGKADRKKFKFVIFQVLELFILLLFLTNKNNTVHLFFSSNSACYYFATFSFLALAEQCSSLHVYVPRDLTVVQKNK